MARAPHIRPSLHPPSQYSTHLLFLNLHSVWRPCCVDIRHLWDVTSREVGPLQKVSHVTCTMMIASSSALSNHCANHNCLSTRTCVMRVTMRRSDGLMLMLDLLIHVAVSVNCDSVLLPH